MIYNQDAYTVRRDIDLLLCLSFKWPLLPFVTLVCNTLWKTHVSCASTSLISGTLLGYLRMFGSKCKSICPGLFGGMRILLIPAGIPPLFFYE